jgi:hypothetical protein
MAYMKHLFTVALVASFITMAVVPPGVAINKPVGPVQIGIVYSGDMMGYTTGCG